MNFKGGIRKLLSGHHSAGVVGRASDISEDSSISYDRYVDPLTDFYSSLAWLDVACFLDDDLEKLRNRGD